jgi:hypothetical protein
MSAVGQLFLDIAYGVGNAIKGAADIVGRAPTLNPSQMLRGAGEEIKGGAQRCPRSTVRPQH